MLLAVIVLVVACVNLANMEESRAISREGEMAVRSALGAGRGRLARQCITESIILALLGGGAGLAIAALISEPLSSICTPVDISLLKLNFQPDWRVFTYTYAIALVAGIVTGLVPARRAWRSHVTAVIHEAGRGASGGRRHHRARSVLVITEIAASTVLLIAAGLFVRSLGAVEHMNLGFDPHHVFNFGMDVSEIGYEPPQGRRFYQDLLSCVRALPGVQSAGYVYSTPFYHNRLAASVYVEGRPLASDQQPPSVFYNIVSPSIFKTLRIPIVRGRDFSARDGGTAPKVAIVNEAMAQRFWPNHDPIGEQFSVSGSGGPWVQVVGVAGDAKFIGPSTQRADPYFFVPLAQNYSPILALQVRTPLSPAVFVHTIEAEVRELAPGLPLFNVRSQAEALNGATGFFLFHIGADLAAGLGVLALLLTMVGVYGVVSYVARSRTHEIGIRMALGARRVDVVRLVVGQGSRAALIGVGVGMIGALGLTRLLSSLLYRVKPTDPLTFVAAALILAAVALLACYIPARRAAKVDPMIALKYE